ncbi:HD-GYP domain-containing protein [Maritalea sp.]|uniref:HD-GYP domain-containing protein n=1 Tax=Maritalea sp. TaxID=2003361 RepID=UPI003EF2C346
MAVALQQEQKNQVRLAELIAALSQALDITDGQPKGHSARACWVGMSIGKFLNFRHEDLSHLYYAVLLKDLGCSSNASRLCAHYLTDDLTFKFAYKKVDGSLPQALSFVIRNTGPKATFAEKFRSIIRSLRLGQEFPRQLLETRCQRGAEIARQMRFSEPVAEALLSLDEHWDGSGNPEGRKGKAIPKFSQIALLSQIVDVFFEAGGRAQAIEVVQSRSGTWFDPNLVKAFLVVAKDDAFWQTLADPDLPLAIYQHEPTQNQIIADEDYLDDVAQGFAKVVDSKSPYTAGHSDRVMLFSDLIAEEMGVSQAQRRNLRRAALLHDIGKLGVSNTVLDKPGRLDDIEFAAVKKHPIYSRQILSNVTAFRSLVHVAGGHHERLDGKGYPDGLEGDEIDLDTRIVTVADIFDALTADRPYRAAMSVEKSMSILEDMVDSAIDRDCFEALKRAVAKFDELPKSSSAVA